MNDKSSEILLICDQCARESYWLATLRALHRGPILLAVDLESAITHMLVRLPSTGILIYDVQNATKDHVLLSLKLIRKFNDRIRILVVGRSEDAARMEIVRQIGGNWIEEEFSSVDSAQQTNKSLANWLNFKGPNQLSLLNESNQFRTLIDLETEIIERALANYSGNRHRTSAALGISRSTLYRKMAILEISETWKAKRISDDSPNVSIESESRSER